MGSLLQPFGGICSCTVCQTDPNCNYEEGRRKVLKYAQHFLRKTDKVRIISKYIEIPDGRLLFTKCYIPLNSKPKGCIFLLIGYATNIDRPDVHENCLIFAENGYMVITHDHIGYGRSDGLWLYIPNSFDIDYVDNAHYIHDYCKNLYIRDLTSHIKHNELYEYHDPSIFNENKVMPWNDLSEIDNNNKYFLCGRSMGGAVATRLAMKYGNDYKGLILLCPMIGIDDAIKPSNFVTWIFKKLATWFPKKTWSPGHDMDQYMVSTENGKNKMNDQMMKFGRPFRLKTASEFLKITDTIQNEMNLLKMDFIVLHGLEDKVTSCNISKNLYNHRKNHCNATIKLYDKSYHMMWWEPCGDQMYSDMLLWINDKAK